MSTFRDVINQALQELGVLHMGEVASADEGVDGLKRLNQMMNAWIHDGMDLEYTTETAIGDDFPYPDDHIGPVVANLAMNLAPAYGVEPSPVLVMMAGNGYRRLRNLYMVIPEAQFDPAIRSIYNPNNRYEF